MGGQNENVLNSDEATALMAKLDGEFISGVTNGVVDTEDAFTHTLGRVPKGIMIVSRDKAGAIYAGGTADTDTEINLKCNVISVAFKAYVF